MSQRVPSLPNSDYHRAYELLCETLVKNRIVLWQHRPIQVVRLIADDDGHLFWSDEWVDIRDTMCVLEQDIHEGNDLNCSAQNVIQDVLWEMDLPIPAGMDDLFKQIELDDYHMDFNREDYMYHLDQCPIQTRLAVHPGSRSDKGPLELLQLWKKLPVDALVNLVGSFVSSQVTARKGLKRRYGSLSHPH